ncbi:MAG: amidohydrolase family protein, partial [Lachnospiraceae bacterium]|nr:amidohydrolase family protein [Lachnospiraceae bacterium]
MNYRITNGTILLPDGESLKTEKADLYIKDGVIAAVGGTAPEDFGSCETVDASGRLVMPGLINMHTHAYMTLLRNYADDVDFGEWLFNRCMPVEDRLPAEAAYWTSLLGCMEMLTTGTTCFVDMHMFRGQSCRAANTAGMRAYIGRGL